MEEGGGREGKKFLHSEYQSGARRPETDRDPPQGARQTKNPLWEKQWPVGNPPTKTTKP